MGQPIPFGEWLPDLPPTNNPGATVAKNVIPDARSYLPFPNAVTYTTSIGGVCKGAFVALDPATNTFFNYAGDSSALYSLTQLSWSNVSRLVGGAYNLPNEDYWEFCQFGNRVLAVNGASADSAQAITVGAANFIDLAGVPPKAKHIATVRDFVVLGNISTSTGAQPQMARWCAINNANSWTPDAATLADFQDLPGEGGQIQKIVGGEYGTIFQERAIYRMTFVGSPLVFQFDKIHLSIGAYAPRSVVNYRNSIFFLSEEGFQMFDGSNLYPIGKGKVDRTFLNDLDVGSKHRVHGVIDPSRKIVAWAYPGAGNTGGNPNKIIIFNWAFNRWSIIENQNLELLWRAVTGTYTLDTLDNFNTNLDQITQTLDASFWQAGVFTLAQFNSSHRLATHNGSAMAATIETSEFQMNQNGLSYITEIRPVAEGLSASVQIAIATRLNLTESATYGLATSINSAGFAEVRSTARFHRVRLTTDTNSTFTHLEGVDVVVQQDGMR